MILVKTALQVNTVQAGVETALVVLQGNIHLAKPVCVNSAYQGLLGQVFVRIVQQASTQRQMMVR